MVQKDKHKIMAIGISILLSLLLWVYVMGEKNPIQTRVIDNVKVTLENTDYIARNNLVLLPKQDYTISISITGRVKDLIAVKSDDFKLTADMSGYLKKGENDIPVTVKSLPRDIEINESEIPKVKVKLDTLSTRFVPVTVVLKGEADKGYEYMKPTAKPTGVMISGPKTYVDEVDKVIGRLNVDGVKDNITKTVAVEPVNREEKVVTNVSIEPKYVDVTVNIAPSKEVPISVKTKGSVGNNLILESINSKISTVKIVGSKDVLDKVKVIETESFDISTITETVTKEIKLIIPEGVSTQSDIKSVGVEFKVNKKAQKDFTVPLNITGRHEGYDYKTDISNINVKITGTEDILSSITKESILANIDVSLLKEGENTVNVKVELKAKGEVSQISPEKVVINITKSQTTENNTTEDSTTENNT